MMRKSKKGFTLVELLVVIAIIAIIAAVAIPVTIGQVKNSKIKTANQEVVTIGKAVETAIGACSADGKTVQASTIVSYIKISAPTYIGTFSIADDGKTITCTLKGGTGLQQSEITDTYVLSDEFKEVALYDDYEINATTGEVTVKG